MTSSPTSLENMGKLLHCLRSEMFPALQDILTYFEKQQGVNVKKFTLYMTACTIWDLLPNAEEELKAYIQKTHSRSETETEEMDESPMEDSYQPADGIHLHAKEVQTQFKKSEIAVQFADDSKALKNSDIVAIETVLSERTGVEYHSPSQQYEQSAEIDGNHQEYVPSGLHEGIPYSFQIHNLLREFQNLKEKLNVEKSDHEKLREKYLKQCSELSQLKSNVKILQREQIIAGQQSSDMRNESHVSCENISDNRKSQLKDAIEKLHNSQKELTDTKLRLSRVMEEKLTDNNPNIADLSDKNRPTKLSERYQELYDNQWTDACERFQHTFQASEETIIRLLKDILMETMEFCRKEAAKQMKNIVEDFAKSHKPPPYVFKQLKDIRKSLAEVYAKDMFESCMTHLQAERFECAGAVSHLPEFVKECFELCWLMVVQDPPLEFGPESFANESFNKDLYKYYTKSGELVEYVVWPVLLLHKDGPVLSKGVAQGFKDNSLM